MTDKTQPKALRIADEFKLCSEYDTHPSIDDIEKAEAELRRLHAENERLSCLCDKWNSECDEFREDNKRLAAALVEAQQAGWTNADADAARLALELECLLMDTKDTAVVSKWWQSANEALELHRARLQEVQPSPSPTPLAGQRAQHSTVYAELPHSVGEHKYGGGLFTEAQMRDFADRTHALRMQAAQNAAPQQEAQEPCQTCAALARTVMLDQVSFDRKPDCYGIRQVTDDEGIEEWEDIRTSPDVAREEANDMMATGRGEIYEVVPLYTAPQPPAQAQEPFGYFRADPFGWTDCASDDYGAKALYEHPAPQQPAPAAQGDALSWLQANDMAALERFAETTDDDESYDIGKEAVQRLAGFGCLRSHGFGKYSITDFGHYVLNDWSLARELPFKSQSERDAARSQAKEGGV